MTATKKTTSATASSNGHYTTSKVTWEEMPVGDLVRVESAQRTIIQAWVRELARDMDLDSLGSFKASKRPNGKYVLLDGGHRQLALAELDMLDWPVHVQVYHEQTPPEEAGKFRRFNKNRKLSAYEDFIKGVKEGDQECVTINRICKRVGLEVHGSARDGHIKCVAAMKRVYNGRGNVIHPQELEEALRTATEAWGLTAAAVEGPLVAGLGELFKLYGGEVDRVELTKKLAKYHGGPSRLLANAAIQAEVNSIAIYRGVLGVIVGVYNKQRRKHKLMLP